MLFATICLQYTGPLVIKLSVELDGFSDVLLWVQDYTLLMLKNRKVLHLCNVCIFGQF